MRADRKGVQDEVDKTVEYLSAEIIALMMRREYCRDMAETLLGRLIVALSARIFLSQLQPTDVEVMEKGGVDFSKLPTVRFIVERVTTIARATTEEGIGASH